MLTIRLNRTGRKNRPSYRVVLQEHTVAPGGSHVEVLGSYDPFSKKATLKGERVRYWIGKGAQASDTAHNLLVREGVLAEKKRSVKMPRPVAKEPAAEAPKKQVPEAGVISVITPIEKLEKVEKKEEEKSA